MLHFSIHHPEFSVPGNASYMNGDQTYTGLAKRSKPLFIFEQIAVNLKKGTFVRFQCHTLQVCGSLTG